MADLTWPTTFVDPWLTGPPVSDTDLPEVRALIEAGLPTSPERAA